MLFVLVKVLKCVNDSGTKGSELSPVPTVNTLPCASDEGMNAFINPCELLPYGALGEPALLSGCLSVSAEDSATDSSPLLAASRSSVKHCRYYT